METVDDVRKRLANPERIPPGHEGRFCQKCMGKGYCWEQDPSTWTEVPPTFSADEMHAVLGALDKALATAAVLHAAYTELKAIVANTSESDNP